MIAIAIVIFKIKKKINEIQHNIEQKINMVTNLAHIGTDIVAAAKKAVNK
jgi:conjugal transfer/entry exclusion protein